MNRARTFILVWGVVNSMVQETLMAMMDKVLTGAELVRIIKAGLMGLRLGQVTSRDVDAIQLVTTAAEFDAVDFKDGDGALYAPKVLLDKLKIDLDKLGIQ